MIKFYYLEWHGYSNSDYPDHIWQANVSAMSALSVHGPNIDTVRNGLINTVVEMLNNDMPDDKSIKVFVSLENCAYRAYVPEIAGVVTMASTREAAVKLAEQAIMKSIADKQKDVFQPKAITPVFTFRTMPVMPPVTEVYNIPDRDKYGNAVCKPNGDVNMLRLDLSPAVLSVIRKLNEQDINWDNCTFNPKQSPYILEVIADRIFQSTDDDELPNKDYRQKLVEATALLIAAIQNYDETV